MPAESRIAQYEVLETLAEDAACTTCRVRADSGDDALVLKRFRSSRADAPEEASRLRHGLIADARRWTRQPPTGLLPIVDAGELPDGVFVVTPWRPEPTLERLVPLLLRDPESALYVLRSIATVLDRLHGSGSVHRSIKATNVFVLDDGDVLLSDALHLSSCSGALMGGDPPRSRALVAAPEQVMGFRQTPASNRYVFAAMAYRLLTGATVFPQEDTVEYLYATVYRVPRAASEVRDGLPDSFDRLLAWGLDKEPSARPRTCVELVDALSAALAEARAVVPRAGRSAVAEELPWEVAPAREPAAEVPAAEVAAAEATAAVDEAPRQEDPGARRGAVMTAMREAWSRPRPLGGPGVPAEPETSGPIGLETPGPIEPEASEPIGLAASEPIEPEASEPIERDAAEQLTDVRPVPPDPARPGLRLLRPIAARSPSSAPAIVPSGPIRYGRDGERSRASRTRRWLSARSGWISRLSAAGGPPRDLEERESYLADWRRGIDPSASARESGPMLPSWPLRVDGCAAGAELFADGERIGRVPGPVELRGRSGTALQLEVRLDDAVLGRRKIRLHPLMESSWDLSELRTEV